MAEDATSARATLDQLKSAFERLEDAVSNMKKNVAEAEAALKDLKVKTNVKLAAVPFIAGASVKSSSGLIDV